MSETLPTDVLPLTIPFDNSYFRLPDRFYAHQLPASVPEPKLIRGNKPLAKELGLDPAVFDSPEGAAIFSGNRVPAGAEPIALAYAGHQFGGWVPQLGDGRAILLGEVVDCHGVRRDIQLKGSGRTRFSRGGDGKAALGPVLREYIVSEAMFALGVPTTRALAAVTTGENVRREVLLPGAVFTRVAASHIRVGTFQYFYARQDTEGLRILADYAIQRHYPDTANAANPILALLNSVIAAQAGLIAKWMSFGFIHGVMNTDNTSVSGETIDYGPCAFMDTFHPQCVFSAIDQNARYAWGNQPSIGQWNLNRFAETLLPILADTRDAALALAEEALGTFAEQFQKHYRSAFAAKLGLDQGQGANAECIQLTLNLLADEEVDFTLFFRQLTRYAAGGALEPLAALFSSRSVFEAWLGSWRQCIGAKPDTVAMAAANPVVIPRNHRIEAAIQEGLQGDFAAFHRLVDALAHPFEETSDTEDLQRAPLPHEVVRQTFCGT